jgi:hypothetical protein
MERAGAGLFDADIGIGPTATPARDRPEVGNVGGDREWGRDLWN